MHCLLVGPGALGCLLAALVSKGLSEGDTLTILDYNTDRAAYLNRKGIIYHTGNTQETIPVTAVSEPTSLQPVDVVLLCVKSYDVQTSLEFCRPILTSNTVLIFLQNGISHLDQQPNLHHAIAAYGTTTEGATLLSPGEVRHAGRGATFLGFLEQADDTARGRLAATCRILSGGSLASEVTDNILTRIWAKLFINVGINALTATLGCKNGELLKLPGIDKRMETAVWEAMQVARAKEIDVMDDPCLAARIVCQKTAENVSSMLQDVRNKRRTEIDAINGAIVAMGMKFSIPTPENDLLVSQIKAIETGYGI